MTDSTADGGEIWDTHELDEIWDTHELDGEIWDTHELDEIWDTHELDGEIWEVKFGTPMNWMESRKMKFGTLYTEFLLAQEW